MISGWNPPAIATARWALDLDKTVQVCKQATDVARRAGRHAGPTAVASASMMTKPTARQQRVIA